MCVLHWLNLSCNSSSNSKRYPFRDVIPHRYHQPVIGWFIGQTDVTAQVEVEITASADGLAYRFFLLHRQRRNVGFGPYGLNPRHREIPSDNHDEYPCERFVMRLLDEVFVYAIAAM